MTFETHVYNSSSHDLLAIFSRWHAGFQDFLHNNGSSNSPVAVKSNNLKAKQNIRQLSNFIHKNKDAQNY